MLRQAVAAHLAGQDAARLQEGERGIGVAPGSSGKRGSTKLPTLGVSVEAERRQPLGEPGQPVVVMRAGLRQRADVLERGDAGGLRRRR